MSWFEGLGPEQTDGCSTPQWLFDVLNDQVAARTGQGFLLDAAASGWNAKCRDYFDERVNALRQDWSRWRAIFCNPPFSASLIAQFVPKAFDAAARGSTIVFILPHWPGYPWFQEVKRRAQMQDIIGPVAFAQSDGRKAVFNNGRHTTSLVVATLGPNVPAGRNGEPITRPGPAVDRGPCVIGGDRLVASPPSRRAAASMVTSYRCDNAFLLSQVAGLYFRPGDRIADVTYGKGAFWRQIDLTPYDFHPSDVLTVRDHPYDFRYLPYPSATFDVHVLDPPYVHSPSAQRLYDADYRNYATTKGCSHPAIIGLYHDGMREGHRILKPGGLMLVKCKDEIEGGRQRMSHIEIHDIATDSLGMAVQDLFIITQPPPPLPFVRSQHARKNHSYLWVFRK
jgi:phage N-6-adenine-methyltransferase